VDAVPARDPEARHPETSVLSPAERRQFDALSRALIADPSVAAAARRAERRVRRRRLWRWLAPLVVARLEARYAARLLAGRG
jgi:hypothetical protein